MFHESLSSTGHSRLLTTLLHHSSITEVKVKVKVKVKVILRLTISQSVSLGIEHPPGAHDQIFIAPRQLRSCFCGRLLKSYIVVGVA
jgi:hypothetical protein